MRKAEGPSEIGAKGTPVEYFKTQRGKHFTPVEQNKRLNRARGVNRGPQLNGPAGLNPSAMLRTYAAGVRGIRTASGLAYRPEGRAYDLSEPETGGSAAVGGL